MADGRPERGEENELKPPKKLSDDLGALYRAEAHVPHEVDAAVMRMASRRLERPGRAVPVLRYAQAGAAVAVCLLLAVFITLPAMKASRRAAYRESPTAAELAVREDLDRNGRVDILDAFALARRIEASRPLKEEWDINLDGRVDGTDVDLIAVAAVSLGRGSLQ